MRIAFLAAAALLAGCSQSVTDYRQQTPVLQLDQFFAGSGRAYGVLHDWRGRQALRFTADESGKGSLNLFATAYFVVTFGQALEKARMRRIMMRRFIHKQRCQRWCQR